MEGKICPVCGINFIEDNAETCSICSQSNRSLRGLFQNHTPCKNASFGETFTFTAEPGFYRGHYGYRAYNSKDEPVGIVFATDDKRTPAYGCCELCIFSYFWNRYGEWHRILSDGRRIEWKELCEILTNNTVYKCYID